MKFGFRSAPVLILAAAISLAFPLHAQKVPAAAEPAALENNEELSESLANDVLDLSVAARDRDMPKVTNFWRTEFQPTRFPSMQQALRNARTLSFPSAYSDPVRQRGSRHP